MKPNRFITFPIVFLGLTALSAVGCARAQAPAKAAPPAANETAATAGVATIQPAVVAAAAVASPDLTTAKWTDIEEQTYEQRALFFAGLARLEARLDAQIAELTVKRATMKGNTDTEAWDFAMREMQDARSYLKSMGAEAGKASSEAWAQQKAKVGEAWVRAQNAYDKVRSSTTM